MREHAFRHVIDHSAVVLAAPVAPLPPPDDDDDDGGNDKGIDNGNGHIGGGASAPGMGERGGSGDHAPQAAAESDPLDELEQLCADMPEMGAAIIRALVAEKEQLLQARRDWRKAH